MADTYNLEGTIKAVVDLTLKVTDASGAEAFFRSDTELLKHIGAIANGKGDNKADDMYIEKVEMGAGATNTIDFVSATMNRYTLPLAWDMLKGIILVAPVANPGTVTIGGAANAVIAELPALPAGCSYLFQWPLIATAPVVAAGASDILTMVNDTGGTAAVLYVVAWGEKA